MQLLLTRLFATLLPGAMVASSPLSTGDSSEPPVLAASAQDRVEQAEQKAAEARFADLVTSILDAPTKPMDPEPEMAAAPPTAADGRPLQWRRPLRRCATRGRRRFCDGPRMVPVGSIEARRRASALGLGENRTASRLLIAPPEPEWIAAVGSKPDNTLRWPVAGGHLGRGIGYVRRAVLRHVRHDGVDIAAAPGTPVMAVSDGIVAYADNGIRGYGNLVAIVHADGSTSFYAHLSEAWVVAGERVERGETIGKVGNTGLSRGPHLHFEWHVRGRPANPVPHFSDRPDGSALASRAVLAQGA